MTPAERALADAHRAEWALVVAATARLTRDLDLAEECVQDAYLSALEAWERDGVPAKPGAWLTTTARRKALDALRRDRTLRTKLHLLLEPEDDEPVAADEIPDDRLRLVFTCCHPVLAQEAQVALTLRLVCGVATPDIAKALLVSEPTMAARLTRAKKRVAAAAVRYEVPSAAALPDRLDSVLTVVHLLFTTGHTAPSGAELVRADLVERSIDLARMLRALMPDEPEVAGLLALLLVTDARRATRASESGLTLLADQDRARWDRAAIDEGDELIVWALRRGSPGRFTLQAAIAALHATAPSAEETDWPQIRTLYDALLKVWPTPVVALNRAVATDRVAGPEAALAEVEPLSEQLSGYRYLHAVKADLLRRLHRVDEARASYEAALALTDNETERDFLRARLGELG
ncbi:RNA polymerase sigma factor [Actinokineospora fastidiosa]|uniref:RNA polymerase sigma factor n=1 Tax=Actinokineospora fastidiosa TaxID=1816 RepID=UPI001E526B2C|nr:sigma-70 family RNA polymerase sigma factor [Actinokineospora fastidiosa]